MSRLSARSPTRSSRRSLRNAALSLLLASIGFGIVTASVLAIASVGLTMQFAVTGVLNLAFSAVMVVSAFSAYWVNSLGLSVWVGVGAAAVVGSVLSLALNRGIYAPFQRRGTSPIALVIVSLGMTLILEFSLQSVVGGVNYSYTMVQGPIFSLGGLVLTGVQFVIIGLSVAVMVAIHGLLSYSRLGKAMRATASNRWLARNCGIRTERVVTMTWAISGALCGLSGAVFAIDAGSFGANSTDLYIVLILAAVFLGGPGQAYGAMLGALIIGLATEISAAWIAPNYKYVVAFVFLLGVLALRPSGILGARTR